MHSGASYVDFTTTCKPISCLCCLASFVKHLWCQYVLEARWGEGFELLSGEWTRYCSGGSGRSAQCLTTIDGVSFLIARSSSGSTCFDAFLNPLLSCMCANLIGARCAKSRSWALPQRWSKSTRRNIGDLSGAALLSHFLACAET